MGSPPTRNKPEIRHGQVLHRPPDLRDRHRTPRHARGRIVDRLDANRAVSDDRAAVDPDHGAVSGRFRADGRKYRRAGDRAADERAQQPDVSRVHVGRFRPGNHDADFRARDQPRHRAGAGAEQAAARHTALARAGAAGGDPGHPIEQQLPAGRGVRVERQQHVALRHRQLRRFALAGSVEPRQRCGQLQRLRHAVRDAHLARHG